MRLVALDLIRFFAAFSVVMYHYTARHGSNSFPILSNFTKFGYLDVPLFFIISGYVISLSANNRSATEFAVSIFVRLYPVFWVGIFITCVITVYFASKEYSIFQILANLTMLNEYLGFKNIDGVYWTLQAELKFYGCVFFLLLFGVFDKFKYWLTIWVVLSIIHVLTDQPFFMGWFISPSYSTFFIAGVAFYLIHKQNSNKFNLSILIISLVLSSVRGFNQANGFMVSPTVESQLLAVVIIWLFYLLFYLLVTGCLKLEDKSIYLILGGLTYPLYLIHCVAGKTIIDTFKDTVPEWFLVISVMMFVLFLSYLIHIGIEKKVSIPIKNFLFSVIK